MPHRDTSVAIKQAITRYLLQWSGLERSGIGIESGSGTVSGSGTGSRSGTGSGSETGSVKGSGVGIG